MIHLKGLFIQRVNLKIDGYPGAHLHVWYLPLNWRFQCNGLSRSWKSTKCSGHHYDRWLWNSWRDIHQENIIQGAFQHYTNKKKIDEIFCRRSPSWILRWPSLCCYKLLWNKNCHQQATHLSWYINNPQHRHEENDTQIPLHILFSIEYKALTHVDLNLDVVSADTNFLLFCWI